jgi:hypothetical protein
MPSYFDIASGLPGLPNPPSETAKDLPNTSPYRYYKCSKHTCNKVTQADKGTINIPSYIPESLDKCLIRYQLKTFLPITIS